MKSSVVPAQITTVEDKIAGNLGLTQLVLLMAPIFIGATLYVIFPPILILSLYKIILISVLTIACAVLAIRVKGKILLTWVNLILQYNLRPQYYVFNKNDTFMRSNDSHPRPMKRLEKQVIRSRRDSVQPQISLANLVKLEAIIDNPDSDLSFKADDKGGLRVVITQIK